MEREAPRIILENLRLLKLNVFDGNGSFKFAPGGQKAEMLIEYGRKFATKFLEQCGQES